MKLWLIERHEDDVGYDESAGFVVRAETEHAARVLASKRRRGDENPSVWLDQNESSCEQITEEGDEAVILTDFKAG